MPDRAGLTHPKDVVTTPLNLGADEVPQQDDVANLWDRLERIRPWLFDSIPGNSRRFRYGDLLEGTLAVATLLVMLVIVLPPWLAISLSVTTYIGVGLLWPVREPSYEGVGGIGAGECIVEEVTEVRGNEPVPDVELPGAEAEVARFGLTRREREILPLLAHRLTDREIAERLSISHRTAMNHTANILHKLGLESRRDIAAFIARHEILLPDTSLDEPE